VRVLNGSGGEFVVEGTDHLRARKQKGRKRKGWGPTIFFKGIPSTT
jgi:hypothetical protein